MFWLLWLAQFLFDTRQVKLTAPPHVRCVYRIPAQLKHVKSKIEDRRQKIEMSLPERNCDGCSHLLPEG